METREILQNIITNFDLQRLKRFFSEKNSKFRPSEEGFDYCNTDNFSDGLKLGGLSLDDGTLLVCAFEAKQELSERSGKKAQYELGKKILKETQTDAGIFIYYNQAGSFRFSLIYANYLGKKRDWSAFRRFTYFVGNDLTNKTFKQRIGDGDFSSLEKIKDAFSVEKVTKEFYEDIANWYFGAVRHSIFPNDNDEKDGRNIAVIRLITRMIFIWFMRERGLVPKDLFDNKALGERLNDLSQGESTYYKAILQNLFFATLSTKKNERKFRSEIRGYKGYNPDFGNQNVFRFQELFKNPEKLKDYFGEIPFLNGGLFECLDDKPNGIYIDGFTAVKKNQPNVPNFLFFSGEINVDLNAEHGTKNKTYKVRGLLNILSSFNFTIDENSPDDQDIALDPELLGRVFENLLASFNPETSTTARKATGSYYTPREIVDYMVTESLKAYFKTHLSGIDDLDKKIDQLFSTGSEENPFDKPESRKLVELIESVRIVDPAVGSGAFPMGALNKMVFILNKVDQGNELWKQAQLSVADTIPDPRIKQDTKSRIEEFFKGKNADYGRKLYLIQKCIYGVDIQQIAVEIAKLRFFISLLVDEGIDKTKENWGIEPLPNLDFKIMQGNSLISEFLGIDFDNGQEKQDAQGQVGLVLENEDDSLIREFERKKIDYQNESDKDKKAKLKNEVEDLMIKIFETKVKKQKESYFAKREEIKRKYSALPNQKQREEIIAKENHALSKKEGFDLENIEKQLREFTNKNKTRPFFPWKIYFAEVFNKETPGFDIVIGNPPYKIISNDEQIYYKDYLTIYCGDLYAYFFESSIKKLLKINGVLSFITASLFIKGLKFNTLRKYLEKNLKLIFLKVQGDKVFENVQMPTAVIIGIKSTNKNNDWSFENVIPNINLIKKVENGSKFLSEISDIMRGFEIGRDKVNLTGEIRFITGSDVRKWMISKIKFISKRIENEYQKNEDFFKGDRILIRETGSELTVLYLDTKLYCNRSLYSIKVRDKKYATKFLASLLNSRLIQFYYESKFRSDTELFPKIRIAQVGLLPIKLTENQKPFIEIVDKILAITKSCDYLENPAKKEEVKEYEKQIDQMVYKLYSLTEEEIKIVENSGKK